MPNLKKTEKRKPALEDAILLAVKAHKGQVDKRGEPYILHPLAVMLDGKTDKERIVGVLHDVLEDTKVTVVKLRTLGYSKEILDALKILTKRPDEKDNYLSYCFILDTIRSWSFSRGSLFYNLYYIKPKYTC